jgi:UDP-glucose 4-epimerase
MYIDDEQNRRSAMRMIVTGGSGRAGTYTVRELANAGHTVINLDSQRPPQDLPGSFIQLDLTDAGEVYNAFAQTRPEGVCHLAANPSPEGFPRQQTFANNVLSTYHVMQAAGDFGVSRLIYTSSEMATGWLTTEVLPPPPSQNDTALNRPDQAK